MTFLELIKELTDSFRERLKNQFIGALVIAWIICNWKGVFVILFSESPIEVRISHVKEFYDNNVYNIILPLLIAFLYTAGLPWLMDQFDRLTRKSIDNRVQNLYNRKGHHVDQKKALAIKERELEDIISGNKNAEKLNSDISKLQQIINTKNSEIIELNNSIEETQKKLESEKTLSKENRDKSIVATFNKKITELYHEINQSIIGHLVLNNLVDAFSNNGGRVKGHNDDSLQLMLSFKLISRRTEDEDKNTYYLNPIGIAIAKCHIDKTKSQKN